MNCLYFLAPLTLLLAAGPETPGLPKLPPSLSLLDLGRSGVRDSNGDGLADAVTARIILPEDPEVEDGEAATHLAARLGFETTAATLPFVLKEGALGDSKALPFPILVGRKHKALQALSDQLDLKSLLPGQGLIAVLRAPFGGADGLAVVGSDGAGTAAAALELGARLPRLWSMTGATLGLAERQAETWAKDRGIAVQAVSTAVLVAAEKRGLVRLDLRIDSTDAEGARSAFQALSKAHHRGESPKVLNFAEVAEVRLRLHQGGRLLHTLVLPRLGLNGRTLTPPVDPEEYLPEPPKDGAPPPSAPAKTFDLGTALTTEGWLGEGYPDLIPDRTETSLILEDPREAASAAHIAARLGLEGTGITLPLAKTFGKVRDAALEPSPILVGRNHALTRRLERTGRVRFEDLAPGEGLLQIVPKAFGQATATVVAGLDPQGTELAARYVARRLPQLWSTDRGAFTYEDLVQEATRFLGGKHPAGQAAQALHELDEVLEGLKDKEALTFNLTLFTDQPDPGLAKALEARLQKAQPKAKAKVRVQATTDPVPVFEETLDLPWEVEELREIVAQELLPRLQPGAQVTLEARVSEPPAVRRALETELRDGLLKAGAWRAEVRVMNAYKQGYSWITEVLVPEFQTLKPAGLRLVARPFKPDFSKPYVFHQVPGRWLQELFPVDEVLARDLGLPLEAIRLEVGEDFPDTYTVQALDAQGKVLASRGFNPRHQPRQYLDTFPDWSVVDVCTGGVVATVDGRPLLNTRIATDMERIWDHHQARVLPRVKDHVLKTTGGKPTADKQPFHRDLDLEVWASEADHPIGVDEERISSLEALHEDLYFVTLDFYQALGRRVSRQRLGAPGKILPILHPSREGRGPTLRVRYAANAAPKPKLDLNWTVKDEVRPGERSRELGKLECTAPLAQRAVLREDRVRRVELHTEPKDDKEAARMAGALEALGRLQAQGLYADAFGYPGVEAVALRLRLKDAEPCFTFQAKAQKSPVRRAETAPGPAPLVSWDHIISHEESEALCQKLTAFPEIKAYRAGRTYRDRELTALEITLPAEGERVSLNKLTALKPTLLIIGRQHANEVSSTSHILRLAEQLARDPAQREVLKKVNVVMAPVWNADGAAMAYELQKLTPNHILHAGRYSALGSDVSSTAGGLLPESALEGRLWREWLPDIYLNPHGYPSHEWTQPFAGYVPPGFRLYWASRGWYAIMDGLLDPREPEHLHATLAVRDAIAQYVNESPEVKAMDLRHQARYRRWAHNFAPHVYSMEVHRDTVFHYTDPETGAPKGSRRAPTPPANPSRRTATPGGWPQLTFMSGITEAPDETAQGDWLRLVSQAGHAYLRAHLDYLKDGVFQVHRIEENAARDGASLTWLRVRPVQPAKTRE